MPKPAHVPTEKSRAEVLALAGFGTKHEDIATYIGITLKTLYKYYRGELDTGLIRSNGAIAKTLYNLAIGGNASACMFWLKCKAGWRETDRHEITGAEGAPLAMPTIRVVFDSEDESGREPANAAVPPTIQTSVLPTPL